MAIASGVVARRIAGSSIHVVVLQVAFIGRVAALAAPGVGCGRVMATHFDVFGDDLVEKVTVVV